VGHKGSTLLFLSLGIKIKAEESESLYLSPCVLPSPFSKGREKDDSFMVCPLFRPHVNARRSLSSRYTQSSEKDLIFPSSSSEEKAS